MLEVRMDRTISLAQGSLSALGYDTTSKIILLKRQEGKTH